MVAKNQSPAGKLRKDKKLPKTAILCLKYGKNLKFQNASESKLYMRSLAFFYDLQIWLLTKTTSKTKDVLSEKLSK